MAWRMLACADGGRWCIKAHLGGSLLRADREVYGAKAVIEFVAKIRDEKKFESLDALKIAISEDVSRVKSFFGHR